MAKNKFPSELRLDLISRDWVIIATGRARRPSSFKKEKKATHKGIKKDCPFCKIKTQEEPVLVLEENEEIPFEGWGSFSKDWTLVSIPNKYPAFFPSDKLDKKIEGGIYQKINAVGFHEVVVTRDHRKQLADFNLEEAKEVFRAFKLRFEGLKDKSFVNHISIFHNHGREAGASIAHPHSQIITTPLIDSDLKGALNNAENYYKETKTCVYCKMNEWERKSGERIVLENENFVAVCPFASKTAFQVIISPKKHLSYYEKITEEELSSLSDLFRKVLKKLKKGLNEPAYNFYLHSAPCDGKKHDYYHWHWTILPKTATWAGFEIGTQMEISTIEPEEAAKYLKKQ